MAAETYGLTTVTYGTPTMTGFIVETSTISNKPQVVAEVFDEVGVRVHARYDDITSELSLDLIVDTGTVPVAGDVLTFDGTAYEVLSVDIKRSQKDFKKVSVKAKRSPGVSLA